MQAKSSVQEGDVNSRVGQILQQVEDLSLDEKAKLAEKLLSIPEVLVVSNNLPNHVMGQIKMMPREQLGDVLQVIGQRISEGY
jgi:hypothetical protein